jgi:bacterioferritin-associated ferredoxin
MDNDKVVCKCKKVSVQNLKDAIDNGAKSFEEVQEATKVGTGCGMCKDSVKVLVDELLGK